MERERDGAAATVRLSLRVSDGLRVSRQLASAVDQSSLVSFLEDIAERHWTGWTGTRQWMSPEGEFWIDATWHRTGGAGLRVTVRDLDLDWQAEATVEVDDMELERLGRQALTVLMSTSVGETLQ
jgi:hypothetical protein